MVSENLAISETGYRSSSSGKSPLTSLADWFCFSWSRPCFAGIHKNKKIQQESGSWRKLIFSTKKKELYRVHNYRIHSCQKKL